MAQPHSARPHRRRPAATVGRRRHPLPRATARARRRRRRGRAHRPAPRRPRRPRRPPAPRRAAGAGAPAPRAHPRPHQRAQPRQLDARRAVRRRPRRPVAADAALGPGARLHPHATRALCRFIAARYSRVIAVNPEIAAALADAGLPAERIVVAAAFTPSSLGFRLPPPGLAQIRRAHPLLIACALAPGPEYGATVLLDAFAPRARAPSRRRPRRLWARARARRRSPPPRAPAASAAPCTTSASSSASARSPWSPPPTSSCAPRSPTATPSACARRWRSAAPWSPPPWAPARPRHSLFPAGDAAACAEQIFQSLAKRLPEHAPRVDCLPTLLDLYARVGAQFPAVATGTALATARNGRRATGALQGEPQCAALPDA